MPDTLPSGMEIRGPISAQYAEILTPEACAFLAGLFGKFEARRQELLAARVARQAELDAGILPDFLASTKSVREGAWKVAPAPADLLDRRTEITGPVDRKMVINALNCGAKVFMADFEDATSPTWENLLDGHINLRDAVRRTISFTSPEGKGYKLNEKTAALLVRPRGWHLPEKHVTMGGKPVSGSFFDFGLYFFHNAKELLARGSGPYFYLPKMESHLEARLWNDVFVHSQAALGVPQGSVRATSLIETILATFEAEEMLYELRDHASGLNCGRWDYIFSCIKKLKRKPGYIFPDRTQITMTAPFMRAYCLHVIKVCHRRGAHAMGGMAAQIPIKNNPAANDEALAKVLADKEREATDGHDGTWVAHPGLVPVALKAFDRLMPGPNQVSRQRDGVNVTATELLAAPAGTITDNGIRTNLSVGIQYLEAWFGGSGCVPLYNLMEDAATAEISRAQLWQWLHCGAKLDDGKPVTATHYDSLLVEVIKKIESEVGMDRYMNGHFRTAAHMFMDMVKNPELDEFLTLPAYELLK
ncbi:MAG TPA: malate synthase A [Opitutaceae bacterium]